MFCRRDTGVALPLAIALLAAVGCGSGSSTASNQAETTTTTGGGSNQKKVEIAVIPKGTTHEYWKSIHAGADKAAKELGGVTIDWQGPEKEDDREGQIKVVEGFTTKKVDGIVLAPLDITALAKPVQDAIDAGIPVVIIDSALTGPKTTSFVATDNHHAGQLGGEELAKELDGKGNVIMLRYEAGSASTMEREAGFLDAMKAAPGIKIISDDQYGMATAESAQKASENLIERFNTGGKFRADGIFCPNESTAFGMLLALRSSKLAGKVKFVGFDSSDQLVAGLSAGDINALVVQDPVKMGHDGVVNLVNSIRGKKVEDHEDTGATVVTKESMAQPKEAALLAPLKS